MLYCHPTPPAAAKVVPWLALLGRLCLLVADRVRTAPLSTDTAASDSSGEPDAAAADAPSYTIQKKNPVHQCSSAVSCCLKWLQHGSNTAQLAAAGYDADMLLQQLLDTTAALEPLTQQKAPVGVTVASSVAGSAVEQLQMLGGALGALAHPHACNNIGCTSLLGPSERQLVGGRGTSCSGCRTARYCGKQCQKQHWKQHKPFCKAIAAVAAAACDKAEAEDAAAVAPQCTVT